MPCIRIKSFALLLALVLSAPVLAGTQTDRERGDLKGPVKSVRTESAAYSGAAPGRCSENKRMLESVSEYNQDGNLTSFVDYNFDGTVHRSDAFNREITGMLLTQVSSDAKGVSFEKQVFDPAYGGRPTLSYMYKTGGLIDSTTTWEYGDGGQPVRTSTKDSEGNVIWGQALNAAGKSTEEDEYKDGALVSKRVLTYDSGGNLIESAHYGADGSLLDGAKDPARTVNKYDSAGLFKEQTGYDARGDVVWQQAYSYDDHENITEISTYAHGTMMISHRTFAYEYDAMGNWTKQSVSEDFTNVCSHPMEMRYRTIRYWTT
ncbi:MAG TPA: hypothetical protein VI756_29130 [Blastocatellia bacterium]